MLLPGNAIADLLLLEVGGCVVTPENLGTGRGAIRLSLSLSGEWGFNRRQFFMRDMIVVPPKKDLEH